MYIAEFRGGPKDGEKLAMPGDIGKANPRFRFLIVDSPIFRNRVVDVKSDDILEVPTKEIEYDAVGIVRPLNTVFYLYKGRV